MNPGNQNFATLIEATCQRQPSRPALFHDRGVLSYGELARLVDDWTGALDTAGVRPGTTVALWLPNCPAFVVTFLAALRLGAVAAPLGALLAVREVEARLAVVRAPLLITTPALASHLGDLRSRVIAVAPEQLEVGPAARRPAVQRGNDDPAVLISTSGTTGKPKAAELTHGGLAWNASTLAQGLAMAPEDVQLAVAPLSHVLGMSAVMNGTLLTGGAVALMERFDAPAALAFMARTGTSAVVGAPSMFLALVREARQSGNAHPLRFAMTGGAALAPDLTRAFEETFGCPLRDGYGMSEVGGGITLTPVSAAPKAGSVGPALPGSELRIVDLVTGAPVPAGERGEVALRSPSVMRGYLADPEATRGALDPDGWLLTGDIGYVDGEGHVFLVDRKKELIIRSGYNVYPREVEDVLLEFPGVREAAVVGAPDDEHGEEVVALIVATDAQAVRLDPEAVKAFARQRLAAYKYPRHVFVVAELAKTPTGKIAKREIDIRKLMSTRAPAGPGR
jgi:long-chain acyl-CoA synthetase